MTRIITQASAIAAIVATINLQIVAVAAAQTSAEMSAAAAQANTSTFMPNVGSLYGMNGGQVEITGVTTVDGALKLDPNSIYYGVNGQSAASGSLPSVRTYEDLYHYRDSKISNLEAGTGEFNSTGDVQAERSAFEVLRNGRNTPSVTKDVFLETTRDLIKKNNEQSEFGQCIIHQITGSSTASFNNSLTELCEQLNIDISSMSATRTYTGPNRQFNYWREGGYGYCSYNGRTIRVDTASTCGRLSMLTELPYSAHGTVSANNCQSYPNCVRIVLNQAGYAGAVSVNFTVDRDVDITSAKTFSFDPIAHQGRWISPVTTNTNLPEIAATEGNIQTISVRSTSTQERGPDVRDPPSGQYNNSGVHYWDSLGQIFLNRQHIATVNREAWSAYNPADGCTYHRGDRGAGGRFNVFWGWYRTCPGHPVGGYGFVEIDLLFNPSPFGPWQYSATRWEEIQEAVDRGYITLDYSVEETASDANGCVRAYDGRSDTYGADTSGYLCGTAIPVDPFAGLPDRGATKIKVHPRIIEDTDPETGENAFGQANTCKAFEENPMCTYMGRECLEEGPNGTCYVHENKYSCGDTLYYTTPTVEEINICESSLSCMGDDCILNTGTNGTQSLADAASKLAALDMIMSDMQCTGKPATQVTEDDMLSCQLFNGFRSDCSRVTLGLSNCCQNATGVNFVEYLQLAFSVSRISRIVEGGSLSNPVTSAWVSMENYGRDSFSALTRPITESWDSIIGNSGITSQGANAVSIEAVKQGMMKNVAQWTRSAFGEQAANTIFQVGGETVFTNGVLTPGDIGLTSGASSVMSTVMTAYAAYALASALIQILFACSKDEQELQVKKALRSTHEVGTYCTRKILGKCVKRKTSYCVFNSPLSRIFNEQARNQLGIGWGSAEAPDCSGITLGQFQDLDMDKIDLSEWTGMMAMSGMLDASKYADIDRLTGNASTLGKAQADLYPRENAINRNINKMDSVDMDALRYDAANDLGIATVR